MVPKWHPMLIQEQNCAVFEFETKAGYNVALSARVCTAVMI